MQIKKIFWRKRVRLKLYFSMHAHPSICNFEFPFQSFKFLQKTIFDFRAVEKGGGGKGRQPPSPLPPPFPGAKVFFHVYMRITCETLFTEQDISDKK